MNNGFSKVFVAIFFIALLVSLPVNPIAVPTAGAQVFDPNTNIGKQLIKNERGDTYLTKEWSDGIGETEFGLPEWIQDENGNYTPYIIMENTNTYVIENKYLPMSINKADCMTTFYLNNENILDGADTLIEKQYWEVYNKENETDNYQLLDTSTWDCDTTFSSGNNFSIFTTWTKSHGYETLQSSQYDTTETFANGTVAYYRTLTETTTTPNVVTGQTTITNSTGTFNIDIIEDVTETTTTNIPVILNEIKSEFQVEYRYMLDDGEVESFTRITNNDVNLENHYFQFINKFEGVNYEQFNLGDDIEFTDDSYIGTYTALAENVPDKYIQIAQEGYPLYYSLEKGEEWWESASATIYMDGAEKKLDVQVDFGKNRTPLSLDTMQELDPTFVSSLSTDGRMITADQGHASCVDFTAIASSPTGSQPRIQTPTNSGNQACHSAYFSFDLSSLSNALVSNAVVGYTVDAVNGSPSSCEWVALTSTPPDGFATYSQTMEGTVFATNDSSCSSTGSGKTVTLNSDGISSVSSSVGSAFNIGSTFVDAGQVRDGTEDDVRFNDGSATLTVTYSLLTVTGAPTSLSASDASTSQIDLSWTAPDTSSATIPAVAGYRIQSSDFAFANSSLPTGRTADADVYGSITGGVDMDTANLYLSMNTTQNTGAYPDNIGYHSATLSGATSNSATAINGKTSLDFDGSNDYISLGTALNNSDGNGDIVSDTGAWTWAGWVYVDSTSSGQHTVLAKIYNDYESGKEHSLNFRQADGNWQLFSTEGGSVTNAVAHTGWTHLAFTVSGIGGTQTWSLYEDGGTATTYSATSHHWDNEPFIIGGQDSGNDDVPETRMMDGQMQDFAFWNRALSQAEIQSLVNSYDYSSSTGVSNTGKVATTIPSGLLAYYSMDSSAYSPTSTTVTNTLYSSSDSDNVLDESYRGNHARLYGDISTLNDDFSSDGWTDTGSGVSVTGGKLNWNNVAMGADNRSSRSIGTTLSDTTWIMRFEFNTSAYNIPNQWIMWAVDTIGNPDSTSQDGIGVVLHDSNKFRLATKDSQTDYYDQSSNYGDLNHTVVTGDNYYIEVARTSSTTATMKVFSDSLFLKQIGSDVNVTIESTITGLDNLQTGVQSGGSSSRTMSANLDDLKIWNGVTEIDNLTLSLDSSLNMEGTNSAVFDGSSNYMTISGTNTIIPTTGAWMMGANIKPDIMTLNPLINYGFEDGSTTLDNAGSGGSTYDGTGSGTTTGVAGKFGNAWDFASGDHVQIPTTLSSTTFSINAWVNPDAIGSNQAIWWHENSGGTNALLYIHSSGSLRYYDSGVSQIISSSNLSASSWQMVSVIHDSDGAKIYINGNEVASGSGSASFGSSGDHEIGREWTGDNYDGQIDQFLLFNTAISDGTLKKLYNSGVGLSDPTSLTSTIFSYPTSTGSVDFNIEGANLVFRSGDENNDPIISSAHGMSSATKYNVAVSRDGSNNFEIFVQGDRVGSVVSNSTALGTKTSGDPYSIGREYQTLKKSSSAVLDLDGTSESGWTTGGIVSSTGGELQVSTSSANQHGYINFEDVGSDDFTLKWKFTQTSGGDGGGLSIHDSSHSSHSNWSTSYVQFIGVYVANNGVMIAGAHDGSSSVDAREELCNTPSHSTGNGVTLSDGDSVWITLEKTQYQYVVKVYDDSARGDDDLLCEDTREFYQGGGSSVMVDFDRLTLFTKWSAQTHNYKFDDILLIKPTSENYYDGKMDEFYVLTGQSDDTVSNISSRSENVFTDRSYNTGGTGTTYSHTSISGGAGTEVAYRVSAHNSVGLGAYDLVLGQTASTPSAPQSLAVAPQMNGDTHENKLTWSNPSSEGGSSISNFKVYRGTGSGFTANSGSLIATLGDVFTYTDSGLDGRSSYYYVLSAVNTQGEGTKTSEVQGTTKNFNVIVKGVRNDNSTALAGYVLQTNSTSANNKFTFNSTGFTIGRTLSDGSIDGSDRMTGLHGNQNFTLFDTGNSFTVLKLVNQNIAENKVSTSFINGQSNIFDIDCSSNGVGDDIRLYVNGTIGHVQTMTTPSCDSDNIITWDSTFTAHGATTGVGDVSLNSLVIAEVLSTGKFGVNPTSFTYGLWNSTSQSTISTTTLGTTYSAPDITSAVLPVSKPTVTTIYNMTMTLDTIAVTPSGGGGGGGGGGAPSSGGILGGLQEFIDESFQFNMASKVHKVELGQTITDSISVSWNQPEEVNIIGIDAGRYNSWFGFQKTPFTLLGDSEGFSNAKIPYKIRIPEVYCDDTTGRTMCAEPILYEVPVLVTGQVNDEVFRGETVVKIDLSKTVQPALFAIFLAFTGGIGAIIYRARASSKSSSSSGKRAPKKKGSFLKELNKDYKK